MKYCRGELSLSCGESGDYICTHSYRLLHDQCVCESKEKGEGEGGKVVLMGTSVSVEVSAPPPSLSLLVSWSHGDEVLGDYVLSTVQRNLARLL